MCESDEDFADLARLMPTGVKVAERTGFDMSLYDWVDGRPFEDGKPARVTPFLQAVLSHIWDKADTTSTRVLAHRYGLDVAAFVNVARKLLHTRSDMDERMWA